MIKTVQKILVTLGFAATLLMGQMLLPVTANAADPCTDLQNQISNGGFTVNGTLPVYCTTGSIYTKILNVSMYIVGIAAVVMIIYGGYLYMTAGANEDQRKKGRSVLTWAIIGLIIVILAVVLVNVVIRTIVT